MVGEVVSDWQLRFARDIACESFLVLGCDGGAVGGG